MDAECQCYYAKLQPLPPERVLPARSHLSILDGHYEPFIRKTVGIGMVNVWYRHELPRFPRFVINGVFGLAKEGKEAGAARSQRVILDARPGNANVEAAPNPQMPDRGSLGEIILHSGDDWAIGTTDLSVYFYTLRVPKMLEGLQGLPPLTVSADAPIAGKHGQLFPTLCVAAMGGSHSSTIAQAVHRRLWQLPSPIAFSPGARTDISCAPWRKREIGLKGARRAVRLMPGEASLTVYADDSMQLAKREVAVCAQDEFRIEVTKAKFLFAEKKNTRPTVQPTVALGYEANLITGMIRPEPTKMQALISDTLAMTKRRTATRGELSSLVGRWTDAMLLRRPVLAIFNAVYESGPRKVKLSTEIAAELYTAVQLAPFLRRNWFRRFHTVIIAYDACLSGDAVV